MYLAVVGVEDAYPGLGRVLARLVVAGLPEARVWIIASLDSAHGPADEHVAYEAQQPKGVRCRAIGLVAQQLLMRSVMANLLTTLKLGLATWV